MKYRCTCTILFDFDSDLPHNKAIEIARKYLDDIPLKEPVDNVRSILQLDKLKTKVEKIKLAEIPIEEFLPFVTSESVKKEYKVGDTIYNVKMNTDRYLLFKNNLSCVSCGLIGTKVFLECHQSDMKPHFNLYGVEENKLVLFTKDHIIAKAFGGVDSLENYQTMCATCNSLKAHSNLSLESVRKLRNIYEENRKKITKKKLHQMIEDERVKLEQPWPHLLVQTNKMPANPVQTNCDLVMTQDNKSLICIPPNELAEGIISVGFIRADSYLEEVLTINKDIICKLPDERLVSISKSYLK